MSKDNFEAGEVLKDYNINTIMKAIADLSANVADLENQGLEYLSTADDSSDVITTPANATLAIIKITNTNDYPNVIQEVVITRTGKTVGTFQIMVAAGATSGYQHLTAVGTATWTDNIITLTYGGNSTGISGSAYFYK